MKDIWPRDDMRFYDPPVGVNVSLSAGVFKMVVDADPDRRVLFLVCDGSNTIFYSPDPTIPPATGIPVTIQSGALVLTYDEHGPMVMVAWYATLTAVQGTNITVFSLSQPRNPADHGYPGAYAKPETDWFRNPAYRTRRKLLGRVVPGQSAAMRDFLERYRG